MGLGNGVHWLSWFIDRKKPTRKFKIFILVFGFAGFAF
jgi:hypothetical protein